MTFLGAENERKTKLKEKGISGRKEKECVDVEEKE